MLPWGMASASATARYSARPASTVSRSSSWHLVVTTRREARRTWTPNKRETHLSDEYAEQLESDTGLPEDVTLMDDRDRRLWLAFGRLTTRCQELLRLTVLAGRAEYRAVAEALAMPHGSIGPTRGRCLNLLRNYLETEGGSR